MQRQKARSFVPLSTIKKGNPGEFIHSEIYIFFYTYYDMKKVLKYIEIYFLQSLFGGVALGGAIK